MTARLAGRDKECIALGYSPSALLNNDQLHAVAVVSELLARIAALESALEEIERGPIVEFNPGPDGIKFNSRSPIEIARAALTLKENEA